MKVSNLRRTVAGRRARRLIVPGAAVLTLGACVILAAEPLARGASDPPAFPPLSPSLPYDVDVTKLKSLVGRFGHEDEAKLLEAGNANYSWILQLEAQPKAQTTK